MKKMKNMKNRLPAETTEGLEAYLRTTKHGQIKIYNSLPAETTEGLEADLRRQNNEQMKNMKNHLPAETTEGREAHLRRTNHEKMENSIILELIQPNSAKMWENKAYPILNIELQWHKTS